MRTLLLLSLLLLTACPKRIVTSTDVYHYEPRIEVLTLSQSNLPTFGNTFLLQDPTDTEQITAIAVIIVDMMQVCDRSYNNSCVPYAIIRYDPTTASDTAFLFHRAGELFKAAIQALVPEQPVLANEMDRLEHQGLSGAGYVLFGVTIMRQ